MEEKFAKASQPPVLSPGGSSGSTQAVLPSSDPSEPSDPQEPKAKRSRIDPVQHAASIAKPGQAWDTMQGEGEATKIEGVVVEFLRGEDIFVCG